jgi:hypothetical protein
VCCVMDRSTIIVIPFLGGTYRSQKKEINFHNSWIINEELVVVWEN